MTGETAGHSTRYAQVPPATRAEGTPQEDPDRSGHDPAACYECTGLPGPATVADAWLRWALDFRPTFLPPRHVRPTPRDMSLLSREFAA